MESLSTRAKGDAFEDEVFEFFKSYVLSGEYSLPPNKCKFYQQKGYYSHKRKSDIKVDMSIEVHAQKEENLSLLVVVECKNYGHPVGVEDIEELDAKLLQIAGRNVKGIVFTRVGFRQGALEYAASTGIALARLLPEDQVDWVLERTPKAVGLKNRELAAKREVATALIDLDYRGQSEAIFAFCKGVYSSSFSRILDELIPTEYRYSDVSTPKVKRDQNRYISFVGQEDIEKRASGVIEYFKPDILEKRQVVLTPICEYLTEHKGVEFIFDEEIGKNADGNQILGKLCFSPERIYITNSLDKDSPRWRFTLAHEIGHFLMHRKMYLEQPEINHDETEDTLSWSPVNREPFQRLEWQANSFASSLLLPRELLFSVVSEALVENDVSNRGHGVIFLDEQSSNIRTYQKILAKLNREFNVSYQAINYRLVQLKILNNQMRSKRVIDIARKIPSLCN